MQRVSHARDDAIYAIRPVGYNNFRVADYHFHEALLSISSRRQLHMRASQLTLAA